jgi:signal transduction histidine kinase
MATLTMRVSKRRQGLLAAVAAVVVIAAAIGAFLLLRSPSRGLPYSDSFSSGKIDEWSAYDGNWNVVDGAIKNDSDERGAKLIVGSPHWSSYAIEADLQLIGDGDAGLIARAGNIERGVDSYNGYYAGLRTNDEKIVLGRAQHGWVEFPPKAMPGGIVPGAWYHLRLAVQGCTITATAQAVGTANRAEIRVRDPGCLKAGKAGLRSMAAGGMWRNVRITNLSNSGTEEAANTATTPHIAVYPTSQGAVPLSKVMANASSSTTPPPRPARTIILPVRNLRLLSTTRPEHVTIRGAVILTTPGLYVQDSSGGTQVELAHSSALRVGDEVEIEGDAHPEGLSARITNATERQIGGIAPIPPASVTAEQAATGAFASMFLEVQGRLYARTSPDAPGVTLELRDGLQSFRAIATTTVTDTLFRRIEEDSVVRVRGVCMVGTEYTGNAVPFALIVNSPEDVKVIEGPPWWSVGHIIAMALVMLALGFGVHLLLSRAEEWRLHAVIDERERLANEMHDTLSQSFAGIGFQLRAIRNRLSTKDSAIDQPVLLPSLLEDLSVASELVRHSHDEARRSIATLRPEAIEATGLASALEQTARRMVSRSPVLVDLTVQGEARTLPLKVLDSLFRIGQEAIANAVRHGQPSKITIRIEYSRSSIALVIEDNGIGFIPRPDSGGFGISGMRRRAESIDGTLDLESFPGGGTRMRAQAPAPPSMPWFLRLAYIRRKDQEQSNDA